MSFKYANDLVIFGVDSRRDDNLRSLPKKYLSVLLVKRTKEPDKDKWCLPGGFVEENETSKDATLRILKKETGLDNVYLQQLSVNDDVDRDPRGRIISTTYMALIDRTLIDNELNENASWFDLNIEETSKKINVLLNNKEEAITFEVKKEIIDSLTNIYDYNILDKKLAFDHDKILVKSVVDLHNKVEHTDIIFHLMPNLFTIGELKQVYELLLGKKLINSAFRRKIKDKVKLTDKFVKTGGHRPSQLCKYNKNK